MEMLTVVDETKTSEPVKEESTSLWRFTYDVTYADGYKHTLDFGTVCGSREQVWAKADELSKEHVQAVSMVKRIVVDGKPFNKSDFPRQAPSLATYEEAIAYLGRMWKK